MQKREKYYIIFILLLIGFIVFLGWNLTYIKKSNIRIEDELKKSIIKNDSLIKEAEGQYSKLVNYYNNERQLKNELKKINESLYKIINKQNERILSLTQAVITLKGEINEGLGKINSIDTNLIDLELKYPQSDKKPFITWIGKINRITTKYYGEWSFNKMPLNIILTEEKRGLWKTRIVGPEWLIIDSLVINSLPIEEYNPIKQSNIQFLIGGGYIKSLSLNGTDAASFGIGISLFNNHNIILNATTNKELGINYYFKFNSFKRKLKK